MYTGGQCERWKVCVAAFALEPRTERNKNQLSLFILHAFLAAGRERARGIPGRIRNSIPTATDGLESFRRFNVPEVKISRKSAREMLTNDNLILLNASLKIDTPIKSSLPEHAKIIHTVMLSSRNFKIMDRILGVKLACYCENMSHEI